MENLKSEFQKKKEAKELAIYNELQKLRANPENSRVAIVNFLCEKYFISSPSTVYAIEKKVTARLNKQL